MNIRTKNLNGKMTKAKFQNGFLSLSAGILGGVALFEIIPEVSLQIGVTGTFLMVILGFVGWWLLGKVKHRKSERMIVLTSLAIWLHSFLEGAFVALSFAYSFNIGLLVALGMVAHLIPELAAVVGILMGYGASFKKALGVHGITTGFLLLGFLLLYLISIPENVLLAILGMTAGAFILISLKTLRKITLTLPSLAFYILGVGIVIFWKFIF